MSCWQPNNLFSLRYNITAMNISRDRYGTLEMMRPFITYFGVLEKAAVSDFIQATVVSPPAVLWCEPVTYSQREEVLKQSGLFFFVLFLLKSFYRFWEEVKFVFWRISDRYLTTMYVVGGPTACCTVQQQLCNVTVSCLALVPSSYQGLRSCGEAQRERPSDQGGAGQSTATPQAVAEERLLQDPGSEEVGGEGWEQSGLSFSFRFWPRWQMAFRQDVSACI